MLKNKLYYNKLQTIIFSINIRSNIIKILYSSKKNKITFNVKLLKKQLILYINVNYIISVKIRFKLAIKIKFFYYHNIQF